MKRHRLSVVTLIVCAAIAAAVFSRAATANERCSLAQIVATYKQGLGYASGGD